MDTTIVTTINPSDKSSLKRFISWERKLMKDYPHYISEIDNDVAKMLTRKAEMAKEMEFGLSLFQSRVKRASATDVPEETMYSDWLKI